MDFGEGDDFLGKTPDEYAMGDRVFCDTNFGRSKRGGLDCEGRVWAWDERSSLLIVPGVLLRCFFFLCVFSRCFSSDVDGRLEFGMARPVRIWMTVV